MHAWHICDCCYRNQKCFSLLDSALNKLQLNKQLKHADLPIPYLSDVI